MEGPEVGALLQATHGTGLSNPRALLRPASHQGLSFPAPLGVDGLRTGAPHSLFFLCPARWALPLSHCTCKETEAQGGQGTRRSGLARHHPPGGPQ